MILSRTYRGVYFVPRGSKYNRRARWGARFRDHGSWRRVGYYTTEEAAAWALKARRIGREIARDQPEAVSIVNAAVYA